MAPHLEFMAMEPNRGSGSFDLDTLELIQFIEKKIILLRKN